MKFINNCLRVHYRRIKVVILVIAACFFSYSSYSTPIVILKLDDFRAIKGANNCKDVMDFLLGKQVKASFGAIANSFDTTSFNTLRPYITATNSSNEKMFEIWNHGLDHVCPEFKNRTYDYQKTHFEQADQRMKKFLGGLQMHALGTPCNASDSITDRVVAEHSNYKVFMFSSSIPINPNSGVMYLNNRVNMEVSTGNPNSAYFEKNYFSSLNKFSDYIVIQAHPPLFNPDGLIEFKKCIEFLIAQGCKFMTPYEYYSYANQQKLK